MPSTSSPIGTVSAGASQAQCVDIMHTTTTPPKKALQPSKDSSNVAKAVPYDPPEKSAKHGRRRGSAKGKNKAVKVVKAVKALEVGTIKSKTTTVKAGTMQAAVKSTKARSMKAPIANAGSTDTALGIQPFETRAGRTTKPTPRSQGLSPYVHPHINFSWIDTTLSVTWLLRARRNILRKTTWANHDPQRRLTSRGGPNRARHESDTIREMSYCLPK